MIQARTRRLADVQARQVEVGRIRLGTSTPKTSRSGKQYNEPVKLDRFRLTSRSQQLIEQAAGLYGGEMEIWQPDRGAQQWQVVVDAKSLPVIVPPDACSQYYEQWTGGRCTRRCDGTRELLEDLPCLCGPDPDEKKRQGCKPTTRVSLMLADMPGIGIWRLETHGYNAAAELPGVVDLLSAAGGNIPARLEMEERQAEVPDPRSEGKTIISRFMVPVLHVEATPAAIVGTFTPRAQIGAAPDRPALEAPPADQEPVGELPPPDEQENQQWQLFQQYESAIRATTDTAGLRTLGETIGKDRRLPDIYQQRLRQAWLAHRDRLVPKEHPPPGVPAAGAKQAAPATPAGGAPAQTPPPGSGQSSGPDRVQLWNEVTQWAGQNNKSMSDMRALFGEFAGSADAQLTRAPGQQLAEFFGWLQKTRR